MKSVIQDKLLTPARPSRLANTQTLPPVELPILDPSTAETAEPECGYEAGRDCVHLSTECAQPESRHEPAFLDLLGGLEQNYSTEEGFARANTYTFAVPGIPGELERDPDLSEPDAEEELDPRSVAPSGSREGFSTVPDLQQLSRQGWQDERGGEREGRRSRSWIGSETEDESEPAPQPLRLAA